jgi:hypothetical protein
MAGSTELLSSEYFCWKKLLHVLQETIPDHIPEQEATSTGTRSKQSCVTIHPNRAHNPPEPKVSVKYLYESPQVAHDHRHHLPIQGPACLLSALACDLSQNQMLKRNH